MALLLCDGQLLPRCRLQRAQLLSGHAAVDRERHVVLLVLVQRVRGQADRVTLPGVLKLQGQRHFWVQGCL